MVARSPQEVMEDPKIEVLLDDLIQTCLDSLSDAGKIGRGKTFKMLDSASKATFNKCQDSVLTTTETVEKEWDNCLSGSSKDLNKMKSSLTKQLTALDNLEEMNGRMQVLEDVSLEAALTAFDASGKAVKALDAELKKLDKKFNDIHKKLLKAHKAVRDAKLKTIIGAGVGAIVMCLTPIGPAVAVGAVLGGFIINDSAGRILNGNEPSDLKKATSAVAVAGPLSKGFKNVPGNFGPVLAIATTAVNTLEAFSNEREEAALKKEIKVVLADIKRMVPKFEKAFAAVEKSAAETKKKTASALSGVRSFKPAKGKIHSLPNMLK